MNGSGSGGFLMPNVYSTLMRQKLGTYDKPPQGETEPEFAQSYEQSADGLTVTFKLRGMKFDDRAADQRSRERLGGRQVQLGPLGDDERRARRSWRTPSTPDAPVLRVETPDAQTVVFKLAFPFAPFFAYLSSTFFPFMYPKEAESGFDTRRHRARYRRLVVTGRPPDRQRRDVHAQPELRPQRRAVLRQAEHPQPAGVHGHLRAVRGRRARLPPADACRRTCWLQEEQPEADHVPAPLLREGLAAASTSAAARARRGTTTACARRWR